MLVVPLWNESGAGGTTNLSSNRLLCMPGSYDSSCDLVPSATGRSFAKFIDECPGTVNSEGMYLPRGAKYCAVFIYPRDATRKRGLCCRNEFVCLSVCPSHAGIVSKRLNLS